MFGNSRMTPLGLRRYRLAPNNGGFVPATGSLYTFNYAKGEYWNGTTRSTLAATHTTTRASVAEAVNIAADGMLAQSGNNVTRIDTRGALVEAAVTNELWNSLAPATQTTTIAAGTYTLQVWGTGSCTLSGGPTGTATSSAIVVFTIGGPTAVTFTVSGSLFAFSCHLSGASGLWTSPISTAGAAATRAAETFIGTAAFGTTDYTVAGVARAANVLTASATICVLVTDANNRIEVRLNAGANAFLLVPTVAGVQQSTTIAIAPTSGMRFGWSMRKVGNVLSLVFNGGVVNSNTPASTPAAAPATISVSQLAGNNAWNERNEQIVVFGSGVSDATLQAYATLGTLP